MPWDILKSLSFLLHPFREHARHVVREQKTDCGKPCICPLRNLDHGFFLLIFIFNCPRSTKDKVYKSAQQQKYDKKRKGHLKYNVRVAVESSNYQHNPVKFHEFIKMHFSDWLRGWTTEGSEQWDSFPHVAQIGSGVHRTSYPMSTGVFSPGVKRPGCEADHSPPTRAEVKKKINLHGVVPN
jgi:hypothetical protein